MACIAITKGLQRMIASYTTQMPATDHNPYVRRWDKRSKEVYYLHRAIAAWKLGRPLRPGEVVHHANGDKADNHPDNIHIFSNQRAHMLFENYQLREERGLKHLFTVDELLATMGLWVVR